MKKAIFYVSAALLLTAAMSSLAQTSQPRTPITQQEWERMAPLPTMGWNSWNKFQRNINEKVLMEAADAMVTSGMKDAGYEYVCVDDCWQLSRDDEGNIQCDPKAFPHGMKYVADYIHSKGLKFGIYSCVGSETCAGRPGSQGHEFQDALFYARTGVDFLKYDFCNSHGADAQESYRTMREALKWAGRPILFNLCEWGGRKPWEWARGIGHSWRATGDIIDRWTGRESWGGHGMIDIVDLMKPLYPYSGPGHWNDADMLEVGNGGLSYDEQVLHFSMWCMFASPLIAGNDLTDMSDETKRILLNREAIAVNQDPLGQQAHVALQAGDHEVWLKRLVDGDWAVCMLNRSLKSWSLNFMLSDLSELQDAADRYTVRDLWAHRDLGTSDKPLRGNIPGHGCMMLRLKLKPGEASLTHLLPLFMNKKVIPQDGPYEDLNIGSGGRSKDIQPKTDLPGGGLSRHPMIYIGEGLNRIFIINDGKVVWKYDTGPGWELDDIWMLRNGNLLFTRMSWAAKVSPDKRELWRYDCKKGEEIHTIQPIGDDEAIMLINAFPARIWRFNHKTGETIWEKEINFDVNSTHVQSRRMRFTKDNTILLCYLGENKVVEYDTDWHVVRTFNVSKPWAAIRLKNGNTLITLESERRTIEVDKKDRIVWEISLDELPEPYRLRDCQSVCRLQNGNTILCSRGEGHGNQLVEVTRDKKVVWALNDWQTLGPATSVQILSEKGFSEVPGDLER